MTSPPSAGRRLIPSGDNATWQGAPDAGSLSPKQSALAMAFIGMEFPQRALKTAAPNAPQARKPEASPLF